MMSPPYTLTIPSPEKMAEHTRDSGNGKGVSKGAMPLYRVREGVSHNYPFFLFLTIR